MSLFKTHLDYRGFSQGVSLTLNHIKTYSAWSSSCLVAGVGVSTESFSCSSVVAGYIPVESLANKVTSLYDTIFSKAKNIKKP